MGFLAETPRAPGIVPHPQANPPTHTHTLSLSCSLIFVLLIGRSDSVVMVARATLPCPQPSLGRSLVTTGLAATSPRRGHTMVVAQAEQCQEGGARHTACQEAWWAEPCRLAGSVAFLPQSGARQDLGGASWGQWPQFTAQETSSVLGTSEPGPKCSSSPCKAGGRVRAPVVRVQPPRYWVPPWPSSHKAFPHFSSKYTESVGGNQARDLESPCKETQPVHPKGNQP